MKAAIIHEAAIPTWSSRRLIKRLSERGVKAKYLRPSLLTVKIHGNNVEVLHSERPVENYEVLFHRSLGFSLTVEQLLKRTLACRILEATALMSLNPIEKLLIARDKAYSLALLASHGIKVPETLITENPYLAYKLSQNLGKTVIKPLIGSLGLGIILSETPDLTYTISKRLVSLGQPVYLQGYVEKPQRDIRVFVVRDRVIGSIYRIARGNIWKTNIAQGAIPKPFKCNKDLEDLAVKICRVLGLHYAGIDFVEDEEKGYIVLEVNASPLWKGLEKATGVDPASEIVDYVLREIKR